MGKFRNFMELEVEPTKEMLDWYDSDKSLDDFIKDFEPYIMELTWFDILFLWSKISES